MIDLDATGPVYRGHKLSRIVHEYASGHYHGAWRISPPPTGVSTLGWARLDVRVIGNVWGLSVLDVPQEIS